ncbi:MAG: hypothetical protein V1863_04735 [Candidatus Omnitrophota bacterium]
MDTKKILIIGLIISFSAPFVFADPATITGTASCFMPQMIEYKAQAPSQTTPTQPPMPAGASGKYEVQKEEKLIQTEDIKTVTEDNGTAKPVVVYSICAK